jgi:hypothetical protein
MIFKKKFDLDLKLIFTLLIIFFIFAFTNSYFFSSIITVKLISLLIFIIGSIPIFNHYLNKKKNIIPLFHLHILFYALIFGVSSFISPKFLNKFYFELYSVNANFFLDNDLFLRNIIFILISVILLISGYLFINVLNLNNFHLDLNFLKKISYNKILYLSLVFFLFQIIFFLSETLQNINLIKRIFEASAYFTICFFYFFIIRVNASLILKLLIILFIVIILAINLYLTNGLMFSINSFLMMSIIFYFYKNKFPWIILFLFMFLILLNPYKHQVRHYYSVKDSGNSQFTLVESLNRDHQYNKYTSGGVRSLNSYFIFHFALSEVPKSFPYFSENSYNSLLFFYIPRIFWSEKPENILGRKFGKNYGFVLNDTTINFPWIAELYLNFSLTGLFFGMFIFGCIMNFLTRIISVSKKNYTQILLGISTFGTLILPEVSFASMFAYSLQNYFFLLFFFFIYSKIIK